VTKKNVPEFVEELLRLYQRWKEENAEKVKRPLTEAERIHKTFVGILEGRTPPPKEEKIEHILLSTY